MIETSRVRGEVANAVGVARTIASRVQTTEVTFLSAAVAYYAFLSLLPALLLLLAVTSVLGSDALADLVVTAAGELLTPTGQDVVRNAFGNAAGRSGATILGVVVLLWSALKVFRGLDIAFLKVYGASKPASLFDQVRDGATAIVGVGAGLVIMLGLGTLLAAEEFQTVVDVLGILLLPALLSVIFLPLYYVFPDVGVSVREVVPGTVFAAVGWTLLQAGFQIYAASAAQYQTYGVLGGILLLVTWFYLAAIVLLVGAVVNVVLAGRHSPGGSVDLTVGGPPELGAVPAGVETRSDSRDRQLQHAPDRQDTTTPMAREDRRDGDESESRRGTEPGGAPDIAELQAEVKRLRSELEEFESDVESRTVEKPELKSELERYVRKRMRRGHARGWGPYLVLLYGTVLTLGAFYWLDGLSAIAAMLVLWLSTLGLYVLFVLFGIGLNAAGIPFRALDLFGNRGK